MDAVPRSPVAPSSKGFAFSTPGEGERTEEGSGQVYPVLPGPAANPSRNAPILNRRGGAPATSDLLTVNVETSQLSTCPMDIISTSTTCAADLDDLLEGIGEEASNDMVPKYGRGSGHEPSLSNLPPVPVMTPRPDEERMVSFAGDVTAYYPSPRGSLMNVNASGSSLMSSLEGLPPHSGAYQPPTVAWGVLAAHRTPPPSPSQLQHAPMVPNAPQGNGNVRSGLSELRESGGDGETLSVPRPSTAHGGSAERPVTPHVDATLHAFDALLAQTDELLAQRSRSGSPGLGSGEGQHQQDTLGAELAEGHYRPVQDVGPPPRPDTRGRSMERDAGRIGMSGRGAAYGDGSLSPRRRRSRDIGRSRYDRDDYRGLDHYYDSSISSTSSFSDDDGGHRNMSYFHGSRWNRVADLVRVTGSFKSGLGRRRSNSLEQRDDDSVRWTDVHAARQAKLDNDRRQWERRTDEALDIASSMMNLIPMKPAMEDVSAMEDEREPQGPSAPQGEAASQSVPEPRKESQVEGQLQLPGQQQPSEQLQETGDKRVETEGRAAEIRPHQRSSDEDMPQSETDEGMSGVDSSVTDAGEETRSGLHRKREGRKLDRYGSDGSPPERGPFHDPSSSESSVLSDYRVRIYGPDVRRARRPSPRLDDSISMDHLYVQRGLSGPARRAREAERSLDNSVPFSARPRSRSPSHPDSRSRSRSPRSPRSASVGGRGGQAQASRSASLDPNTWRAYRSGSIDPGTPRAYRSGSVGFGPPRRYEFEDPRMRGRGGSSSATGPRGRGGSLTSTGSRGRDSSLASTGPRGRDYRRDSAGLHERFLGELRTSGSGFYPPLSVDAPLRPSASIRVPHNVLVEDGDRLREVMDADAYFEFLEQAVSSDIFRSDVLKLVRYASDLDHYIVNQRKVLVDLDHKIVDSVRSASVPTPGSSMRDIRRPLYPGGLPSSTWPNFRPRPVNEFPTLSGNSLGAGEARRSSSLHNLERDCMTQAFLGEGPIGSPVNNIAQAMSSAFCDLERVRREYVNASKAVEQMNKLVDSMRATLEKEVTTVRRIVTARVREEANFGAVDQALKALKGGYVRIQGAHERMKAEMQRYESERAKVISERDGGRHTLNIIQRDIRTASDAKENIQQELIRRADKLKLLDDAIGVASKKRTDAESSMEAVRGALETFRVEFENVRTAAEKTEASWKLRDAELHGLNGAVLKLRQERDGLRKELDELSPLVVNMRMELEQGRLEKEVVEESVANVRRAVAPMAPCMAAFVDFQDVFRGTICEAISTGLKRAPQGKRGLSAARSGVTAHGGHMARKDPEIEGRLVSSLTSIMVLLIGQVIATYAAKFESELPPEDAMLAADVSRSDRAPRNDSDVNHSPRDRTRIAMIRGVSALPEDVDKIQMAVDHMQGLVTGVCGISGCEQRRRRHGRR